MYLDSPGWYLLVCPFCEAAGDLDRSNVFKFLAPVPINGLFMSFVHDLINAHLAVHVEEMADLTAL